MREILAVMPFVDLWPMTKHAAQDVLDQSLACDLLLIDNASVDPTEPEAFVTYEREDNRAPVRLWRHDPPLPSLCATWNAACRAARDGGYRSVWLVNNDVRLHHDTLRFLALDMATTGALFVSAVGVREEQWSPQLDLAAAIAGQGHGGPDYSCFLLSIACWEECPFDEAFTYYGDNDHHYRMRLLGYSDRIYSVNLPYLHYGSATIKRSEAAQLEGERVSALHRAQYILKWGGVGGQETYKEAYGTAVDGQEER